MDKSVYVIKLGSNHFSATRGSKLKPGVYRDQDLVLVVALDSMDFHFMEYEWKKSPEGLTGSLRSIPQTSDAKVAEEIRELWRARSI